SVGRLEAARFLLKIATVDGQASFAQENAGILLLRLLRNVPGQGIELQNVAFAADALRGRHLIDVTFRNCFFELSSLEATTLEKCTFNGCRFVKLKVYDSTKFVHVRLTLCDISSLRVESRDVEVWDPASITAILTSLDVTVEVEHE